MTTIYTLSHPITGEIRYVGKTAQPLYRRLNSHRQNRKRTETHTAHWVRSLYELDLRPVIEEIDLVPDHESCESEMYWIRWYRNLGARLTNHTNGGEGNPGLERTPEWRGKIGNANRGELNAMSLLTLPEAQSIYDIAIVGDRLQQEIASQFNVSRRLVGLIKSGHRWPEVERGVT